MKTGDDLAGAMFRSLTVGRAEGQLSNDLSSSRPTKEKRVTFTDNDDQETASDLVNDPNETSLQSIRWQRDCSHPSGPGGQHRLQMAGEAHFKARQVTLPAPARKPNCHL